jgi:uncharacterized protein (TIGR02646 family)
MRYIKKLANESIAELDLEKAKGPVTSSSKATLRWKRFSKKDAVRKSLIERQLGLCCYTELNLTDFALEQNMGSHIEHEKPKSSFPQLTFDFENLLLCALNDQDLKSFPGPLQFGGHFKRSNYEPQKFVSPHQKNCRDFFIYSSDTGEISPNLAKSNSDQQKAQYSIDLLNLNAPFLKAERKQWLEEIESCLQPFIEDRDIDSIWRIAETELLPYKREFSPLNNRFNQLRKFHSAVRNVFGALGDRVIIESMPSLI